MLVEAKGDDLQGGICMAFETCREDSQAPTQMLRDLPESQGGLGRHRCPNCAYVRGRDEVTQTASSLGRFVLCGHGSKAPEAIVAELHENQGGSGRHKCVVCSYQEGRASVLNVTLDKAWDYESSQQTNLLHEVAKPETTWEPPQNPDWWKLLGEHNKKIGDAGEELVIEYEMRRLIQLGRTDLANEICHSARVEGDHLGYDIKSFNEDGTERYIEVKSTTLDQNTPFFVSRNEVRQSIELSPSYWIYRVYGLDLDTRKANFYKIHGDFDSVCVLEPQTYKATIKNGDEE